MKLTVIKNDLDKTLESFGFTTNDIIGDMICDNWEDDVNTIEFTPVFDFDYDYLIEMGADKFWDGDGFNEPRQFHLQGDVDEIAEQILEDMLDNIGYTNKANILLKFIRSEVKDSVSEKLN